MQTIVILVKRSSILALHPNFNQMLEMHNGNDLTHLKSSYELNKYSIYTKINLCTFRSVFYETTKWTFLESTGKGLLKTVQDGASW